MKTCRREGEGEETTEEGEALEEGEEKEEAVEVVEVVGAEKTTAGVGGAADGMGMGTTGDWRGWCRTGEGGEAGRAEERAGRGGREVDKFSLGKSTTGFNWPLGLGRTREEEEGGLEERGVEVEERTTALGDPLYLMLVLLNRIGSPGD